MVRAPIPLNSLRQYPRWAHHPWFQGGFGTIIVLAGLVGLGVAVPASQHAEGVLADARLCGQRVHPGCLQEVPGRITDRRGKPWTPRWHFVPDDVAAAEDRWVRFGGDEEEDASAAMRSVLGGEPVVALYADGDVVAFEAAGERVPLDRPGDWRRMAWFSLFLLGLGVMSVAYAWHRRDRPEEVTASPDWPPAMPRWPGVVVMLAIGCLAAAFAGRLATQVVTFVVVAGSLLVLVALTRRWAAARDD